MQWCRLRLALHPHLSLSFSVYLSPSLSLFLRISVSISVSLSLSYHPPARVPSVSWRHIVLQTREYTREVGYTYIYEYEV